MIFKKFDSVLVTASLFFLLSTIQFASAEQPQSSPFQKCAACHSTVPGEHILGPSLSGILGRKAASLSDFRYSRAMKKESKVVWNASNLDKYIKNPQGFIPGNKMAFDGIKDPKERKQLIKFFEEKKKEKLNASPK